MRSGAQGRRSAGIRASVPIAAALACAALPAAASAGAFSSVEPRRIEAGSFYDGATVHVHGSIDARSQVAIRVVGPPEHHPFNRRGKIGGVVWGGIEHVAFEGAPSLYAVYSSAALGALAPAGARERLRLGYDTLVAHIEVRGGAARPDKAELVAQLVRLKEKEGLYRVAPGAVHLGDPAEGRRSFEASVPIPSTAAPGDLEIAVLELADGAVRGEDVARVTLDRVGLPASLFHLAHRQGTLFGVVAVLVLLVSGVAVDLLGVKRGALQRHPAILLVTGLVREVDDTILAPRRRPRSAEDVARMHQKYRLFRALLSLNAEVLENLAELEEESSWSPVHDASVRMRIRALFDGTADMVATLNELAGQRYFDLANVVTSLRADVFKLLEKAAEREQAPYALPASEIGTRTAPLVGDKAVNLARVECDLGLRVPELLAVTIEAYRELLAANGLGAQLRTILGPARLDAPVDFRRRCELAQSLVRDARVPPALAEAIHAARRASGFEDGGRYAVRSSAAGEGSALSFAGQFDTFLNVAGTRVVDAWKDVVASRFSPRAVFYRRAAGLADVDTPMAVLVQRMVRARASGVLFTRPPDAPRGAELLVTASRGLGPDVSLGVASADQFVLSRSPPHRVLERRIAPKRARLVGAERGGVTPLAMGPAEQLQASVADPELERLAAAALAVERYFGAPQDVEWALDEDGQLFILQARPLRIDRPEAAHGEVPRDAALLLRGGEPAWAGRAVGPVHAARTPREEEDTPEGALLVVPQLLPDCVRVLPRVCGVVVERGSVTGHAASLLREFRVPSLLGATGALDTLVQGRTVSLDVGSRGIYDGALWPELRGVLPATLAGHRRAGLPDLLAGKLTRLSGSAFLGTWALRSLHDVIRFAHEMAIQAMFDLGDRLVDTPLGGLKTVDCPQPLHVHLLDLGGGIAADAASKEGVTPAEVASAPFQGLWRGLADEHFRPPRPESAPPAPAVLAASMVLSEASDEEPPNYACITESYLNLHSRGGIERDPTRPRPRRQSAHFVVVDSFLAESPNENHVRMRLKGGGAAPWQRRIRAEVAAEILRQHHFTATVTDDLMNAWIRGVDRETGADALAAVGRLLRFLSRLDLWMTGDADVKRFADAFVAAEAAALAARERAAGGGKVAG